MFVRSRTAFEVFTLGRIVALFWVLGLAGLALGDAIHVAVEHNDDDALYELIQHDAALVDLEDDKGDRPLHIAAGKLHREVLIRLLNANANFDAKNRAGFTPLHLAIMQGGNDQETAKRRVDAVQILLLQGASPETPDARGWTALHHAAARGRFEVLETLRAIGARLDVKDYLGRTPIHLAAQYGHVGVLNWLHRKKLSVSIRDKQGWTPLHCAVERVQIETVKRLLELGASASAVTEDGRTAFHVLAEADLEEVQTAKDAKALVEVLAKHGADASAKDKKGRTAAELAMEHKHAQLAELIKSAKK